MVESETMPTLFYELYTGFFTNSHAF